jgi:hypothetical protein
MMKELLGAGIGKSIVSNLADAYANSTKADIAKYKAMSDQYANQAKVQMSYNDNETKRMEIAARMQADADARNLYVGTIMAARQGLATIKTSYANSTSKFTVESTPNKEVLYQYEIDKLAAELDEYMNSARFICSPEAESVYNPEELTWKRLDILMNGEAYRWNLEQRIQSLRSLQTDAIREKYQIPTRK